MPRNGAGTFSVLNPILIGQLRSSSAVNEDFSDAGDELTNSLPLDGSAAMTGQFLADGGDAASPGVSFSSDPNSGFRRSAANELRWVAGAQDRAIFGPTGLLTLNNGLDVTGSVNISSVIGPQVLSAFDGTPLTMGREENDTSEHELASYEAGDGSGAKASLRVVGSASNNVSAMRFLVNSVEAFAISSQAFSVPVGIAVGSAGPSFSPGGYVDMIEVSTAPSAPAANTARLYALDVSGNPALFYKDSAGTQTPLDGTPETQVFTASGTWTRPDGSQSIALIEAWGGGGAGGSNASSGDYAAGGGGGAYSRKIIAIASLSAAVSVTVGSGGGAVSGDNLTGGSGGDSSFGGYLTAYGGGGGSTGDGGGDSGGGGSGGGLTSAGNSGGAEGGGPISYFGTISFIPRFWGRGSNPFGGGAGTEQAVGDCAFFGGGGGGPGAIDGVTTVGQAGGDSIFGGGGGGGDGAGGVGAGGASVSGGGGGAGGGVSGSIPAGGGGGNNAGTSGAGARGEVRVTVW